jgi:hypothetical protein
LFTTAIRSAQSVVDYDASQEETCGMRDRRGPDFAFRGSKRRVRKLVMRGNASAELGWVILWVALIAALLLPRLIRQSSALDRHVVEHTDRATISKVP